MRIVVDGMTREQMIDAAVRRTLPQLSPSTSEGRHLARMFLRISGPFGWLERLANWGLHRDFRDWVRAEFRRIAAKGY